VRRLTPFQKLALWTTAVTYLLILVGGLVRASGAGLGCPDWPRCFGSWIPPRSVADLPPGFDPAQFNPTLMWTEYLNRLLGVAVGFTILATVALAWRHHRRDPHILWPAVAALVLTGFEGWLGGRVVAHELAAWIVTVHLVVALVIVSLLLYATVHAFYRGLRAADDGRAAGQPVVSRTPYIVSVAALMALTLLQVGLGTQVRGGVDAALDAGIARPRALGTVGSVDTWHRDAALAVGSLAMVSLLVAWKRHGGDRVLVLWTEAVVALAALQIVLGLVMAYVVLAPAAQVLHLTLASLLLGAQTVALLVRVKSEQ
jgi:cytochrome c oxidase assembly protein subunit 15